MPDLPEPASASPPTATRNGPKCPICRKPAAARAAGEGERSAYPFCSERCRLIDLGRWLDGVYQVPVEEPKQVEEEAPPDEL